MAANQTSNQRQGQQSGQRPQHGGQESQSRGQSQSAGMYETMSDMAEQASDYVALGASQVQECIREYSGTAVVVSLVAGFGIGLAIGKALSSAHSEPQTWRDRIAAEGLGRRLMESIESIIPDALSQHFTK
jgi:hypothetical protein